MANEIQKSNAQLAERPQQALDAIGGKVTDIERSPEVAAIAIAAAAKAAIEARVVMALRRPRSYDRARDRILATCQRPAFSDRAIYKKPQGKVKNDSGQWEQNFIKGLSIRFAEEMLRDFGNIEVTSETIYDDDDRTIVKVTAVDLETMAVNSDSAIVTKRVERKGDRNGNPPNGRDIIGSRANSYGDKVYICRATDDEMATRAAAAKAKLRRNMILSLIPVDLTDEARAACEATSEQETARNLPQARERMVAAFGQLRPPVTPDALSKYLGHDVRQASVPEMADLKQALTAISEGTARWDEFLEAKLEDRAPVAPPPATDPASKPREPGEDEEPPAPTMDNPPTEPAKGTDEFATWLIAKLKQAADMKSATKIAARKGDCPVGRHAELLAVFNAKRAELTGK